MGGVIDDRWMSHKHTTSSQKEYFKMVEIRNPMNLKNFMW
jgi:hypothetical protein